MSVDRAVVADLVVQDLAAELAETREIARAYREVAREAIHATARLTTEVRRLKSRLADLLEERRYQQERTAA